MKVIKNIALQRLAGIAIAVAALGSTTLATAAPSCFASKPLASLTVTSPYGPRVHPVRKILVCHCGIDFRARTPLPIFAVDSGVVRMTRTVFGGGNTVELFTDKGVVVQYMHLSQFNSKAGDRVSPGDMLGKTGQTGEWQAGPHLHFITKVNGSTSVDPSQFICDASVTPAPPLNDPSVSPAAADAYANKDQGGGVMGPNVAKAPAFPSMDGMSLRDFLYSETHKRFMNPQWYKELENPGAMKNENPKTAADAQPVVYDRLYHLTELNTMLALKNLLAVEKREQKESIEARTAALLSTDAKNYSEKIQAMTRQMVGAGSNAPTAAK